VKTLHKHNGGCPFSAIIFDMDGVIVNSHPVHRKAWERFLRLLGRDISESELDYIMDGHKRADILCHFLGPLSAEQILEYGQRKDLFFQESAQEVQPVRGLIEFIEHVANQGKRMAVATSASESRTRFTLEQLGLRPYFETVVTGKDVSSGKPAPDIYRAACERLDIDPGSAVAFEDAMAGVTAAKAAGLHCVGVLSHQSAFNLTAAGADLTIPDFTGLSLDTLQSRLASVAGSNF
jgi:beta-phosphoglucomutase